MSKNINFYSPQTGRRIKEDNSIVNTADMLEAIYNALVVDKNAGMQLSGSNVKQFVNTGIEVVPAGTSKVFEYIVPIGFDKYVNVCARATSGQIAKVIALHRSNSYSATVTSEEFKTLASTLPSSAAFTRKLEILTDTIRIQVEAGPADLTLAFVTVNFWRV